MQLQGLRATVIEYSTAIRACEKGRQWRHALGFFEQLQSQSVWTTMITHNVTISACEQGKHW